MRMLICCLIVLLGSTHFTCAENLNFEDNIVVKGEAVAKTATVNTISAEEIKKQGATTVAEALELVPGVYVRVGGKGEAYVRMRGFRQREIAVLINGMPIASPYDGQLDLSSIPSDTIEKIEVVKGAASVMYGSNAMGGVINIITKKSDGTSHYSFNSELSSGSAYKVGVSAEGSINNIRYMLTASRFNRDHYPLSGDFEDSLNQDAGNRDNSDRNGWQSMLTFGWDGSDNSRHTFNINSVDIERGLPHHVTDKKAKFWRFTDWKTSGFDYIFEKELEKLSIKTKLFYATFENTLDGFDDATYSSQDSRYGFTSTYDDYDFGADFFARYRISDNQLLKFGLRGRRDVHREQADLDEMWLDHKGTYLSLPVEYEHTTSNNWTVVTGVSFDMMKIEESHDVESHHELEINPQIAVLIPVNSRLNFKSSYSRKTRFGTLKELFSERSGNPELESMKNTIAEIGLEYIPFEGLNLSLVAFSNKVTDMIYRVGKYEPYQNIDKATFNGFETEILWAVNNNIFLNASYSFLNAKDHSDNSGMYIEHRPKHQFNMSMDILLPAGITMTVSGGHVSTQMYLASDDTMQTLDNFTLLNVRLAKSWNNFEFYGYFKNLTDELYYESEGYPLEGKTWAAGFRYDF